MRAYKLLTSDGALVMLKGRIEELEQQHWAASLSLVSASAIVAAAPEADTQRATSEREAEQLERNVASLELALDALIVELDKAEPKAAKRARDRIESGNPA